MIRSRSRRVSALRIKPGPTESGKEPAVGGVILHPVNYFVLGVLALLVLGIAFLMYRKREAVIRYFTPMLLRLMHN